MIKLPFILFLVLGICACSTEKNQDIVDDIPVDLEKINTQYWDKPSRMLIQKYRKTPVAALSHSQKKRLSEILITHHEEQQAILLLQTLDYSKNQYLSFLMALAYYQQGQIDKSLRSIQNNSWNPKESSVLNFQYKLLLEMGASEKILELSTKENISTNSLSKYYLAMAFLQSNKCQESIPLFYQVTHENPYANKIYSPLANALQQCNRTSEAKRARAKQGNTALSNSDEFHSRLLKNGDPVSFYKQSLNIALEHKQTNKIIEASENLISLGESNINLLNNYAISLYQSNNLESANDALFDAIKLDNNNTKSYQLLFEFNRENNTKIAENAINRLIEIEPNNGLYKQAKNYLYTIQQKP